MRRTAIRCLARIAAASERARETLGAPQRVAYGPSEHRSASTFTAPPFPRERQAVRRSMSLSMAALGAAAAPRKCARRRAARGRRRSRSAHRLHQCRSGGRRSDPDISAGQQRARLGLAQRRKLRRRPRPAVCFCALVRRASRRLRADERLARGRLAGGLLQRRAAHRRHVRPCAGAALEPFGLCQVHRRDGTKLERDPPYRRTYTTPLIVAHGTCETPEFQRQTRDFSAAVKAAGKPAELIVGEGYNHFELFETLANPYGILGRASAAADGIGSTSRRSQAASALLDRGPRLGGWLGAPRCGSVRRRSSGRHRRCLRLRRPRAAGVKHHPPRANRAGHHQRGQT